MTSASAATYQPQLARRLGLFDATMIVMGGIIGSGIFINPYVVARQVHSQFLILGVWALGGLIALAAAFIWAELAARRPDVGGQYAYLREAFHPSVAFLYGWVLLLVIQTGGMAAVAVTFSRYFLEMAPLPLSDSLLAAIVLALLTIINCLGVRAGSTVQSIFMVLKIVAIVVLVICGLLLPPFERTTQSVAIDSSSTFDLFTAIGAAMVPVLFAYGGWQTATFVASEIKRPERNLPRGLIFGVIGVVLLYLAANFVYLRVLGPNGLAATNAPATDVMRKSLGNFGARAIATGIAISTVGFLSQSMLTAPRVYFAMARDGLFFKSVATVHSENTCATGGYHLAGRTGCHHCLLGRYEQILNYVVSMDFIFFGLTACCIFVFRKRSTANQRRTTDYEGAWSSVHHCALCAACWLVVINTIYRYPANTLIGVAILLAGIPAYLFWRSRSRA